MESCVECTCVSCAHRTRVDNYKEPRKSSCFRQEVERRIHVDVDVDVTWTDCAQTALE